MAIKTTFKFIGADHPTLVFGDLLNKTTGQQHYTAERVDYWCDQNIVENTPAEFKLVGTVEV